MGNEREQVITKRQEKQEGADGQKNPQGGKKGSHFYYDEDKAGTVLQQFNLAPTFPGFCLNGNIFDASAGTKVRHGDC